ncbi:MAG: hypothetical protein ACTSQ7_13650 [Alphaproteobacteria bacterium]
MDEMYERLDLDQLRQRSPVEDIPGDSQDYRLTTAEILYQIPEYPDLLQSYLWQSLDRVPDFPKLNDFLSAWEKDIEGKLHSVRIGYVGIIQPEEWRYADSMTATH